MPLKRKKSKLLAFVHWGGGHDLVERGIFFTAYDRRVETKRWRWIIIWSPRRGDCEMVEMDLVEVEMVEMDMVEMEMV